jgi:2-keto-4-pentenoate hydratase/2-oxohepta-3-ene-1,7-dioic acid hydratase in catechol pathway
LNYPGHAASISAAMGHANRGHVPDIGYRSTSALIAHGDTIVIPADATDQVHYEGELVVVIGKRARNLDLAEATAVIFGYTIGNDVSERTWQKSDATFWRAKNADTFKPMGPWIETNTSVSVMETCVRLNGQEQIRFPTGGMLYG